MKRILLFLFFLNFTSTFSQNKNQFIGFTENKGQIVDQKGKPNTAVKYLLTSGGLNVQLKKNGFSYDIYDVKRTPIVQSQTSKILPYQIHDKEIKPEYNLEYNFHRIDIDFVNSNSNVELITAQESKDFDNYYNLPNKPEGIVGVHLYKQITYKNIYPNIDVVFTIPNDPKKVVEYNFIVHPKGKISDIKLKFKGAETELIDNKIQMNVRFGKMEETLPASWTEEGNTKKEIAVEYRKMKNDVYGFATSDLVSDKTLIIDPVPIRLWGTYYGGEDFEYFNSVFVKDGFIYLAGITYSSLNIASTGASQNTLGSAILSSSDSFLTKFNSDGTRVWGTYYGGNSTDEVTKVVVSDNDNIYIAGASMSPDNISTFGSHQQTKGNYFDGFLAKFDKDGIRKWGTYYGGSSVDYIRSLLVDANEKIYIAGETRSKDNIATNGSFQPVYGSTVNTDDAFIAKFNADGVREWGTYYGGSETDEITNSKLDSSGNIIFVGITFSNNNISTPNSYQETKTGTDMDSFLLKFDVNGNRIWSTYLGGEKNDFLADLGIDSSGNIYCFGQTYSASGISTSGAFEENLNSNNLGNSGCILKLDSNGFKIWGTYFYPETFGGSVSKNGSLYFTGRVAAGGFSATPNAYQEFPFNSTPGTDSYFAKFDSDGQRKWATYFSGEAADDALTLAIDQDNNIYLAGVTVSKTNIATPGTYQTNLYPDTNTYTPNHGDAFLVKFKDCESTAFITSNSPICIGKNLELKASGGTAYSWSGPNGFISTDQNPIITNATTLNSGEYTCIITGADVCDNSPKINVVVGDIEKPIPDLATLPTITGDCHTTVTIIPTATDACAGAIIGTTTNALSYSLPGTYTLIWNYNDGNGNIATQNQTVVITSPSVPNFASTQFFCERAHPIPTNNTGEGPGDLKWYISPTSTSPLSDTDFLEDGITYYVSRTSNGCESTRVPITIRIRATYPPTGNANQRFCSGFNPTLNNIVLNGTNLQWYDALTNGNVLPSTTNLQNGKTYYASQAPNICESERFAVTVSVQNSPAIPTGDVNPKFCKSEKATLSNIHINEQNLIWYESASAVIPLANNTLVQNNTTYYVAQLSGCESERLAVLVTVSDSPVPIVNNTQQFCIDENATISNINITGNNIKWYDLEVNGNVLPETIPLQNKVYYATQTLNNCESERFAVTVKVQNTQNPIVTSPQIFCIQQKPKISDIKVSGQNIKWFESQTSNISLSESALLENGVTYYVQETINNCESDKIPVKITILEATSGNCINLVEELPFPKFFTPNNDGYNDTWTINFAYLAPNSSIRIFDRYGKFIKELTLNTAWDGTYIGTDEPSSDYWFVVTRLNGVEFKSHFSLKR
ncbi:gliding motility-associated-like protein [Flavobacterium sp. 270]|uniref:DUF7948 domain-containing protein n=1 Tax=Flavobacterium sp. 270 TaxID=2512114 RepID=UPI0010668418|nr:T9SS type B sorting domain-containing protein [Flavobacterium sp. 270]TDW48617.1 gliding motility-associated-like protein [Flavobacterium sp. 270]